jgi:hypothetical protein
LRGGETTRARWPLPIGVTKSITRREVVRHCILHPSGWSGSVQETFRGLSGDSKLIASTLIAGNSVRLPWSDESDHDVSPVRRSNGESAWRNIDVVGAGSCIQRPKNRNRPQRFQHAPEKGEDAFLGLRARNFKMNSRLHFRAPGVHPGDRSVGRDRHSFTSVKDFPDSVST